MAGKDCPIVSSLQSPTSFLPLNNLGGSQPSPQLFSFLVFSGWVSLCFTKRFVTFSSHLNTASLQRVINPRTTTSSTWPSRAPGPTAAPSRCNSHCPASSNGRQRSSRLGPRSNDPLLGSLKNEQMGMGQNESTRNWTACFSLWFHLPGFHFGYIILTHSQNGHGWMCIHLPARILFSRKLPGTQGKRQVFENKDDVEESRINLWKRWQTQKCPVFSPFWVILTKKQMFGTCYKTFLFLLFVMSSDLRLVWQHAALVSQRFFCRCLLSFPLVGSYVSGVFPLVFTHCFW